MQFGEEPPDIPEEYLEFPIEEWPDIYREKLADWAGTQLNIVMEEAEKDGVLFRLLTEWPRAKIAQYELMTLLGRGSAQFDN